MRGRPRQYYKYILPLGVVKIVRAYCADYKRRAVVLKAGDTDELILHNYASLNAVIDGALARVETECREHILADIAFGRGYDRTQLHFISRKAYYARKNSVIYDIAVRLNLIK